MSKFLLFLCIMFSTALFAKKVKFAVDMTGQTISAFGVHVAGDFQILAGYTANWDYGSTTLTQEGGTDIYSVIVNIPAFSTYEFKFVNGDQGYETEYVPDEVRVGYDFNDNRWLYVDSLNSDTTFMGAIKFGLTSPANKYTIRYKVDMTNVSVNNNGVHTSTNYNLFSTIRNTMVTFATNPVSNIYEVINYVDIGTHNFNYINGNTLAGKEASVPISCSNNGVRYVAVNKDTIFPEICFNYCVNCVAVGIKENQQAFSNINLYPNPAKNILNISSSNEYISEIVILNVAGQNVFSLQNLFVQQYTINILNLTAGIYFVKVSNSDSEAYNIKLIIE